jgi:hypothetical protein
MQICLYWQIGYPDDVIIEAELADANWRQNMSQGVAVP